MNADPQLKNFPLCIVKNEEAQVEKLAIIHWSWVVHPIDWIRPRSNFTCPTFSYQQLKMRNKTSNNTKLSAPTRKHAHCAPAMKAQIFQIYF